MAADGATFNYGQRQTYIWLLLSDSPSASAPTYDAAVQIQAAVEFKTDPDYVKAQLEGDDEVKDTRSKTQAIKLDLTYRIQSAEALEILYGHQAYSPALGGAGVTMASSDRPQYFGIDVKSAEVDEDGGCLRVSFLKCKVVDGTPIHMKLNDYGEYKCSVEAIPATSNDVFGYWAELDNDVDLSAASFPPD